MYAAAATLIEFFFAQNQNIMPESTPAQVTQWLTNHRLTAYLTTFAHFSGADIMR